MAHVALTIEWFFEGAFRPEGFDVNFEQHIAEIKKVSSLQQARDWLQRAVEQGVEKIAAAGETDLQHPIAEGPVMGGLPRFAIIGAIADHTAHHRGALTVYSRLLGKVPDMPY